MSPPSKSIGSPSSLLRAVGSLADLTDRAALGERGVYGEATRKPLEMEVEPAGSVTLHSVLPRGLAVVDNDRFAGKKLVATQAFKAGDVLYRGYAAITDLSNIGHGFRVRVYSDADPIKRLAIGENGNTDTHFVGDHTPDSKSDAVSKRQVFGRDSFMNHSCDPNTYFLSVYRTPTDKCNDAIAIRSMCVGDELTCDYVFFDYCCDGRDIEVCECGASNCRGRMMGFRGLSFEEKVSLLHLVDGELKHTILTDEHVELLHSSVPAGIDIEACSGDNRLVASRKFEAGELLFRNRAHIVSKDDAATKRFVLHTDGKYFILESEHHFIHRAEYAETLGFDSFMNHSCDPNTRQNYLDKEVYEVYARRTIDPGESITCDYTALKNDALGMDFVALSSFECTCGAKNCYGLVSC